MAAMGGSGSWVEGRAASPACLALLQLYYSRYLRLWLHSALRGARDLLARIASHRIVMVDDLQCKRRRGLECPGFQYSKNTKRRAARAGLLYV